MGLNEGRKWYGVRERYIFSVYKEYDMGVERARMPGKGKSAVKVNFFGSFNEIKKKKLVRKRNEETNPECGKKRNHARPLDGVLNGGSGLEVLMFSVELQLLRNGSIKYTLILEGNIIEAVAEYIFSILDLQVNTV